MAQPPKKKRTDESLPLLLPPMIPAPVTVYPAAPGIGGGAPMQALPPGPVQTVYPMGAGGGTPFQVSGSPVRGALPPGTPRVFNMRAGGSTPGQIGGAPVRALLPSGSGAAGGAASAAGAATSMAARFALPSAQGVARAAGAGGLLLGTSLMAGEGALNEFNDLKSPMNQRAFRANKEMNDARARNASGGEKAGIAVRNVAGGAVDGVMAGVRGVRDGLAALYPSNFIEGLFPTAPKAPAALPVATLVDGRAPAPAAAKAAAGGAPTAATPIDDYLQINQLVPLLQALPSVSGRNAGPQGKDALYDDVRTVLNKQLQDGMNAPGANDASRSRLLDRYLEQMQVLLGSDPLAMQQIDMER